MSEKSKRINIVDHLEKNGRRWIKKELKNDRKNIKSFLDLTLQFDKTERLSFKIYIDYNEILKNDGK